MTDNTRSNLRRAALAAPAALAMCLLAACSDDDDMDVPAPMPSPTPAPSPTPVSYDVTPCVTQEVVPGTSVADLIIPDTLTLDFSAPSGFPNGRKLPDPVIDVTLAVIFLDLNTHSPTTLASLPLNPPANDVAFPGAFPFLAPPQGSPPITTATGSTFGFRTDAATAYTRVDRMGMPAVSTALIPSDTKAAYNDADPADDAGLDFVDEITGQLTALTNALADDLVAADLTPCATPA